MPKMTRAGNTGEAMRRCRLIILALLLPLGAAGQAAVSVEVDRAPVIADQAFRLIFESAEEIDAEPDFSPLSESFTLLGNNRQTSVNIVNGRLSRAQKWVLTLITDKTGTLTIPPIAFGNINSEARRIEVVAEARPAGKSDDIFIEVEVDEPNPYVQAQVVYTLKLLRAAQVSNASLTEPTVADGRALINKLGEDKNYQIRRNNRSYRVTERRYAVFPQASGPLKIEPVLFKGQSGGGLFSLDPFAPRPEPIVIRSAPVALAVRPIPAAFSGDRWLPAARLNIQEQWSTDPALLKQGEAATRALTLEAGGLAASQLPAPASALPDSFKTYPDQPEFEEASDRRGLVGTRREKMAVIPLAAGEFTLPAIRIPWWNTETDRPEVAELTARRVKVQAAAPAPARPQDEPAPAGPAEAAPGAAGSGAGAGAYWPLVSFALLILWLGTLALWWRGRRVKNGATPAKPPSPASIKRACMKNDAAGARDALLCWAGAKWPDKTIKNLAALGARGDTEFQRKISALNRHLYGQRGAKWDGPAFYRVFATQSFAETTPVTAPAGLEPLWKF